jgi:hypothetical protein
LPLIFEIAIEFSIAFVIALFLAFANEQRSRYYTSFWVESIPIVWWLLARLPCITLFFKIPILSLFIVKMVIRCVL